MNKYMDNVYLTMNRNFLLLVLFVYSSLVVPGQVSVSERSLNENWKFKEQGTLKWLAAKVPGCVHTDLIENGIIEDPFYRLNESKVQWIDKKDWVYLNQFEISKEEFEKTNHELQFEGLDTYAKVYLNDSLILNSNNMHRTYNVDVKKFLKKGVNYLKVILESPIRKGIGMYDALDYKIPVSANDQAEKGEVTEGKRISVFTRKAGYHYGWDWGPRLVTSGIWRPIKLISWYNARVTDFDINYKIDELALIQANIIIESSIDQEYGSLDLKLNDSIIKSISAIKLKKGNQKIIETFTVENPRLWWPNGMGEQYLYKFEVDFKTESKIENISRLIGLRSIDFIPDSNFHFNVNNKPTFIKGVNYIPQDIFLPRVSNEGYEKLIVAAKDANMNMIRVWGGGVYENSRFYELCDSLGLMVWQDFMFACAMYPGDDGFLENIRLEAKDNYNRLKKHTCIALWCGNNENLSAWKRWGWEKNTIKEQSPEIAKRIWKSYDTLFHSILPSVVQPASNKNRMNNNHNNYWASSPSASEGIAESYDSGDTHYWGVWWGKEPFENFNSKISCFMSEYGFQSFPEYSSFKKFGETQDENMYSDVMKHHQRSSIGNATIEEYMQREFTTPTDFKSLLYTSQILQADGIRLGIEAHRRNDKCMGSIYWQLNDCWPGASWSSIDYYGKWKALHYAVKKAFSPVIISHEFIDSNLHVSVISDDSKSFNGEIKVVLSKFKGESALKTWNKAVGLKANESKNLLIITKEELLSGESKNDSYLSLLLKENNNIISSKNVYFLPFKELIIPNPVLKKHVTVNEKLQKISVTIKSQNFAKGVHVTSSSSENFSDNFFDLPVNGEKTITLNLTKDVAITELISSIKIVSLWDTIN
jgi:beta-mannosidase